MIQSLSDYLRKNVSFSGSSFSDVRICCFSLSYMIVNWIFLGFWTDDVPPDCALGYCDGHFSPFSDVLWDCLVIKLDFRMSEHQYDEVSWFVRYLIAHEQLLSWFSRKSHDVMICTSILPDKITHAVPLYQVPLARSEGNLLELMESVCERMEDYGERTDSSTNRKSYIRVKSRSGEPMDLSEATLDSRVTASLKFAVSTIFQCSPPAQSKKFLQIIIAFIYNRKKQTVWSIFMQHTPPNLVTSAVNCAACNSFVVYFSSVKQLLSSMKMKSLNSSLMRRITSKTNSAARGPVCFWVLHPITHFCSRWSTAATVFYFIVFLSRVLCRPLRPRSENAPRRTLISSRHRCRLSSAMKWRSWVL